VTLIVMSSGDVGQSLVESFAVRARMFAIP
jgi:hypothetical protein